MYYLGWLIINIDIVLALIIFLGICLSFNNKSIGKWITFLAFTIFFFIGHTNIVHIPGYLLESSIEKPVVENDSSFEGIIILGGNFSLQHSTKERPIFNLAASRLFEGILLAKKYPDKKIIFTGTKLEADLTKKYFEEFGIERDRMFIDDTAKNTSDNAKNVRKLLGEDIKKTWVLVTSAFHMKRSALLFKEQGIHIIPYPIDYHAEKNYRFSLSKNGFLHWYAISKEFLGLLELNKK
jgi:uncharacterized SAM-binding protein YcdF (DUF218 family)